MARLLDPISIKNLTLKNRIVMPPMANNLATEKGEITPRLIDHYVRRAGAEVALLIVEHSYVVPTGRFHRNQLGIHDDTLVTGLRELVDRVHAEGAKIGIQITHAGSATTRETTGYQPEAPSPVIHPVRQTEVPRELTVAEIEQLVEAFAQAAQRAVRAGFDMVEIHSAHGYLLNEFLSPLTNKRTDEYGGDLEGRARFPLEVTRAVRKAVGPEFPVFYRLGADDRLEGGLTLADSKLLAPRLQDAGVDVLDISGGLTGGRPEGAPPAYFLPLAEGIKPVIEIPVILTGGITEPLLADRIVREGKADLIGIGRALLADPEWAVKAVRKLKEQEPQGQDLKEQELKGQ